MWFKNPTKTITSFLGNYKIYTPLRQNGQIMNNELKRAIIVFLIGFFTLGIGNFVFIYLLSDKIVTDDTGKVIYPLRELILTVVTFGIYGIFWTYKLSKTLDSRENREEVSGVTFLSTALSAVFLKSISCALICYRMALLEDHTAND